MGHTVDHSLIVLSVYCVFALGVAWHWLRRPPVVGYYVCSILGLTNLGLILISRNWLPSDSVSVWRTAAYLFALGLQGVVLVTVSSLHRRFTRHLGLIRQGGVSDADVRGLNPALKTLVLVGTGVGSVAVVSLILSGNLIFLQLGRISSFYLIVGATLVIVGLARFQSRRRTRP